MKKNIVISSGDPGGVGGQIIIRSLNKLLEDDKGIKNCNFIILGDLKYYKFICHRLNVSEFWDSVVLPEGLASVDDLGRVVLVDFSNVNEFNLGATNALYGKACIVYLEYAIDLHKSGILGALVTAPICKKSLWEAGYKYAGHTHYFAVKLRRKNVIMSMLSDVLKVFFVTDHIAFSSVPRQLKVSRIKKTIQAAIQYIERSSSNEKLKVGVCSLNPHGGEGGIFGIDEKYIIEACRYWEKSSYEVVGPLAPEVCFKKAVNGEFAVVIAMYHDQGMIPFKLFSKGEGINVTWGLPFVRVSPEHGTAFDIAKDFIADEKSMHNALKFAIKNLQK